MSKGKKNEEEKEQKTTKDTIELKTMFYIPIVEEKIKELNKVVILPLDEVILIFDNKYIIIPLKYKFLKLWKKENIIFWTFEDRKEIKTENVDTTLYTFLPTIDTDKKTIKVDDRIYVFDDSHSTFTLFWELQSSDKLVAFAYAIDIISFQLPNQ